MSLVVRRKVVIYCVKDEKLLVFTQPASLLEAGVQVPAGTIRDGEALEVAATRELVEETGKNCFGRPSFLGRAFYDQTPYRDELHERYFFLVRPTQDLPESWDGKEEHDGLRAPTAFNFFWLPLRQGHVLAGGQGALLGLASRL